MADITIPKEVLFLVLAIFLITTTLRELLPPSSIFWFCLLLKALGLLLCYGIIYTTESPSYSTVFRRERGRSMV